MNGSIEIRNAVVSDAKEISELVLENALALLKPYYSDEQWNVFARYYSVDEMEGKLKKEATFCAVKDDRIVGTVSLKDDFVLGFYTRLQHLKQGIGKTLMDHLEAFALDRGISELQLAASPIGLSFYYKYGWEKIRDFTAEHFGVGFEETLMRKKLALV
ncbi:MAG: GNAT family N-acetyltransferase [Chitinophagaceae bacterium]|nr:MAG: GNAT family N-acetyltransferase [Chitinophagaceae bacterium]